MGIGNRKLQHVEIALKEKIESRQPNGFEAVRFEHHSLPEMDLNEIDLGCTFLGRKLSAPLMIASMTGGYEKAGKINRDLAVAAEMEGIPLGLGSQRAMLEKPGLLKTFNVRDVAPKVMLFGNIGAFQLKKYTARQVEMLVSSIGADALCIHLNPLQEAVQHEGDKDWAGVLPGIAKACDFLDVPVIAKETGAGISANVAKELEDAGVAAIDVSGVGGTSWSAIELFRKGAKAGAAFWDWGNPTAECLIECSKAVKVPLVASGGVRNGLDAAKAIRLGASLSGAALPFLKAQDEAGVRAVQREISSWKDELRIAMFLTRSKTVADLRKAKLQGGCCGSGCESLGGCG